MEFKRESISITAESTKIVNVNNEDLYCKIRGLFILGRLIGLIPLQGVFKRFGNHNCLKYKHFRLGWWINVLILVCIAFNATICFIGMCKTRKQNAAELAWAFAPVVFYAHGTFIYFYFLRRTSYLLKLFVIWEKAEFNFDLRDKTLSRDAFIITGFIFTSAVLENLMLQLTEFPVFETGNTKSALQIYLKRSHGYWDDVIAYNWFWSVLLFLTNKFALYSWNFVDILIAVFSRAIYGKFKLLVEAGEKVLGERENENLPYEAKELFYSTKDSQFWAKILKDHEKLCNILNEFQQFLSPLLLFSYAINTFFTCLQIFIGLSPSKDDGVTIRKTPLESKIYSIYATWSFIHLLARLYIVSICAANVNFHAHQISRVLRQCPTQNYTSEVERLERKIADGKEIGLNALGCFVVTKPFILNIIGVVFTFEIVLLQSSSPAVNCGIGT